VQLSLPIKLILPIPESNLFLYLNHTSKLAVQYLQASFPPPPISTSSRKRSLVAVLASKLPATVNGAQETPFLSSMWEVLLTTHICLAVLTVLAQM
jgi:hypothetical protein